MKFVEEFINYFFGSHSRIDLYETDEIFSFSFTSKDFLSPNALPNESLAFLQSRDDFRFTVVFGNENPISYYSRSPQISFIEALNNDYKYSDGEAQVEFVINKNKVGDTITIYDLPTFASTISAHSISESFAIFSRAFSNSEILYFEVVDLYEYFNSATLFFKPVGFKIPKQPIISRIKIIENLKSVSYFTNLPEYALIPDDFSLVKSSSAYSSFCLLLTNFASILSVIYLFDITSIKDNTLDYKINGYKTIKGKTDISIGNLSREYFSIYQWVFGGGNLNDKIGLARNIISLHFLDNENIQLKGEPFQSIQSSYKIYEKQNIKQYIEIRNKISDQLLDFSDRANKIIETFASGFQKSSLALISFYISAIALKVLGKGEFKNIFTLDATLLSITFIAGAYIYYHVSIWEVKAQRQRFVDSYANLKERYTDLLEKADIERILNNDKEYFADIKFINDKLEKYSTLWLALLFILLSVSIILFIAYTHWFKTLIQFLCSSSC